MSFPRCLLQIVGERSQIPQCSLKQEYGHYFSSLPKVTFASSSPLSPPIQSSLPDPHAEDSESRAIPGRFVNVGGDCCAAGF
jgi:hypothetical protein